MHRHPRQLVMHKWCGMGQQHSIKKTCLCALLLGISDACYKNTHQSLERMPYFTHAALRKP